jgi:hypothetical protein
MAAGLDRFDLIAIESAEWMRRRKEVSNTRIAKLK